MEFELREEPTLLAQGTLHSPILWEVTLRRDASKSLALTGHGYRKIAPRNEMRGRAPARTTFEGSSHSCELVRQGLVTNATNPAALN